MATFTRSRKLSRTRDQRRALIKGLAEALIERESILTTMPKAKALRPVVEKLITRAKVDSVVNRRLVRTRLSTDTAMEKLFKELGPRYKTRPGGYTRITAEGWRRGDDAKLARISFMQTAPAAVSAAPTTSKDAAAQSSPKPAAKPQKASTSRRSTNGKKVASKKEQS